MSSPNLTDREFEQVVDFVAGTLPADQADNLSARAAADKTLSDWIVRVRSVIGSIGSTPQWRLDPGLVDRLKRLFDPTLLRPVAVDGSWPEIVADLIADTRTQSALSGFRGVASSYQLTFSADGIEVHLQVIPSDDDEAVLRVLGQVDAEDASSVELKSLVGGEVVAGARCDEYGYFELRVRPGVYDLEIRLAARSVVVRAVEMG